MGTVVAIDHTGDVGIEIRSETLPELFEDAARGLTEILLDPAGLSPQRAEPFVVEEEGEDLQLRAFLAEILYRFLSTRTAYARVEVTSVARGRVEAVGHGETLDPARHAVRTELKAVTYHQLEVRREDGGWFARVIFDI